MSNTLNPVAELKAIQTQLNHIAAKSKAEQREFTESEYETIELGAARATQLKAAIERGIDTNDALEKFVRDGGVKNEEGINGGDGGGFGSTEAKSGYLPAGAFKRVAQDVLAGRELKALVAGGTVATPIPLDPEPIKLGSEPLGVLTLFAVTQRANPDYSYLRQTVRTEAVAKVADGAAKPTSTYTLDKISGHLETYAHLSQPVPKYLLQDAPALARFLSGEMNAGVVRKVEADVIAGINTTSGIQTVAAKAEPLASIYSGIVRVAGLGFSADAIILNPADWEDIVTARNAGGTFDVSGTVGADNIQPTIYGRPVILTSGQAAGSALVLDREAVGISTDLWGIETEWNPYAGFANNTVIARVEGRFALDVFQPAAVAKVDLEA